MKAEQVNRVCDEMNNETKEFLAKFSSKLDKLFSNEASDTYLTRMVEHLRTFYEDVFNELEDKRVSITQGIEDLYKEVGELEHALNTEFDFSPEDGLPLMVLREKLDQQLVSMREMYKEKRDAIEECLLEQEPLVDELGEEMRVLSLEPLATDAEVSDFKLYLKELREERVRRLDQIDILQNNIRIISTEIEMDLNGTLQKSLSPTKQNIQRLQNECEYLQKKRDSLRAECDQLVEKLTVLWECLDCPEYLRGQYLQTASQYTQTAIDTLTEELKRCKIVRQENMKAFIENIRKQIVAMWDKCYKSEEERNQFRMMRSDAYSEDLLTLHEYELEECKRFYTDNENIFEMFHERNTWWERKKALDAKQNEPNRYNNRGGQLLKEEKERKLADNKIPKIEKEIAALAEKYEEKTQRKFTINGECLVEMMERQWENYRGSKELLKSARKVNATPAHGTAKTPRTPMSARGQLSMKRIASTTNLAMSTGNTAKRRHLELPSSNINITSSKKKTNISSVYAVKPSTKRNLMSQLNDQSGQVFARPQTKHIISHVTPSKSRKSLTNVTANRIVKKYRRSSKLFNPQATSTDESLLNYDVFENHARQMANSSIIEQQENLCESVRPQVKTANAVKTPIKSNLPSRQISKSPLKPTNFTQLKATKKAIDI